MIVPSPLSRIRAGLGVLALIFLAAVAGYWWLQEDWTLLDSVYMVVITLASVGYGEKSQLDPETQVFTILFIVFGVSTGFYIMGGFVQMMAEGEINRALGFRRVSRELEKLDKHVIICGFGRMGEALAEEIQRQGRPFVVVENTQDRIAEAVANGYLALADDATEEEALLKAGIKRAKVIVTTLPGDAENVFITLSARDLNPDLQIIARGEFRSTEKKLIRAGANRVVMPARAGALKMAAMITRPATVELVELVSGRHTTEVEVDELTVSSESSLVGKTVRDSQTRARHGLLIVALRHPDEELLFNPDADTVFQVGDTLSVMGKARDIERFRAEFKI